MSIQLTLTIALAVASSTSANEATNVMLMPIASSDATIAEGTMDALQVAFQKELADLKTQVSVGTWPTASKSHASRTDSTSKNPADTLARVEGYIKRGKRSLRKRRYQSAHRSFQAAVNTLHANADALEDTKPLVRSQRLVALSQYRQGKKRSARNTLAAIVTLPGSEAPKPGTFPKKFMALEASVRAESSTRAPGSLHVAQGNKVETVYLDGKAMGRTPLNIEAVAPGAHVLRLERNGTHRSMVVTVASKQRAEAAFEVKKVHAKSVTDRIQQNRFDATVRQVALEQAKKGGAQVVVVASLERSIVGMVYTSFMGRVSDGTWTRLRTVRPDVDLLNVKVGLSSVSAEIKTKQHTPGDEMGREQHSFRPVHALASGSPSIAHRARTVFFARNP